jgi:20S proteasome subunit beta 6
MASSFASKPFRSSTGVKESTASNGMLFVAHTEGPVYANMLHDNDDDIEDHHHIDHGITRVPGSKQHSFSPYEMNGGTVAAIAGPNYCVIASDTRCSAGYEILSRNVSHLHTLNANAVLASSGCKTDIDQLRSVLDIRLKVGIWCEYGSICRKGHLAHLWLVLLFHRQVYEHNHRKDMSIASASQLLSNTLYYKRFFPYYAFNLLAGIDAADGSGAVYSYDAIGSFERSAYSAKGSGQMYIIPVLDNVIGNCNRLGAAPSLTAEEVVEILKDAFVSAGERDIYTGDTLEIQVLTHNAPTVVHTFPLKKD